MKYSLAILALCLCLVGCGKAKPTPDAAANRLFVEAVQLIDSAEEQTGEPAIKDYEQALAHLHKIISDYNESDLAVKLISGETLFTGKSLKEIKERVKELKRIAEVQIRMAMVKVCYVFPDLIELAKERPGGGTWDATDATDGAPDITYAIYLNDREIFKAPSTGKNNTINEWGVSESAEGNINAAKISINVGDTLKIKVWDADPVRDDEAGEFIIKTAELKLGQTEWWRYGDSWSEGRNAYHPHTTRGLKRLRLRVIDATNNP